MRAVETETSKTDILTVIRKIGAAILIRFADPVEAQPPKGLSSLQSQRSPAKIHMLMQMLVLSRFKTAKSPGSTRSYWDFTTSFGRRPDHDLVV
jgi:hypothetical protein